ncbi:lysine N(6)-hydroxylase/L-ornithine N(5)-oxygenase family protein [Skermania sp. ID1734]|nr:lysine N(6)-hydroxylase/L-ornithine N(5)-oxygenase family protein [Skermania sp. ID1734]
MRAAGVPAPRIIAVEPNTVAGNWLSGSGWTDGNQRLGTSPEKDVGFPYGSHLGQGSSREINRIMMSRSWSSFLVEHSMFAEWIDRGRPHPQHHLWAKYLQWVAAEVGLKRVAGRVTQLGVDGGSWRVTVAGNGADESVIAADAVMITGPGPSDRKLLDHPRVLSIAEFWDLTGRRQLPAASHAAVIGGGETAGSALDELVRHDAMLISVISPNATLYTRGESYFENSLFSDPSRWSALSPQERREVIRRTDRGVFSVRVQDALLGDNRIHHLQGRVVAAYADDDLVALSLHNETRPQRTCRFDLVVDATGGNPLWFTELLDDAATDILELAVGWPINQDRLETVIDYDLSVSGLRPKLFLPNLAGIAQGPGFANLSCLGALSDRVLRSGLVADAAATATAISSTPGT